MIGQLAIGTRLRMPRVERQTLLVVAVAIGLLIVEAGLGRRLPHSPMQTLTMVFLIGAGVLAFQRMDVGLRLLLLWPIVGYASFLPAFRGLGLVFSVAGRGIGVMHVLAGGLLGVLVSRWLLGAGRPPVKSSLTAPMIMMIGVSLVSLLASYAFWEPDVPTTHRNLIIQLTEIGLLVFSVGLAFVAATCARTMSQIRAIYNLILIVGLVGFWLTTQFFTLPELMAAGSVLGMGRTRAGVVVLPIVVAMAYSRFLFSSTLWNKLGWFAVLLFLAGLNLVWVSPPLHLGSLGAMLLISLFKARRQFFLIVLLVLVLWFSGSYDPIWEQKEQSGGPIRFELWTSGLQMWQSHPILGVGPGNYAPYTDKYNPPDYRGAASGLNRPHGDYIYWLTTTGIAGAAAFLWLVAAFFSLGLRILKRCRDDASRELTLGILGAWLGALLAMAGGHHAILQTNLLDGFTPTVHPWVLAGLLISLGAVVGDGKNGEQTYD